MSAEQETRNRLQELLKRPPKQSAISSVQKTVEFKKAYEAAAKHAKTWSGGIAATNNHLHKLSQYIE